MTTAWTPFAGATSLPSIVTPFPAAGIVSILTPIGASAGVTLTIASSLETTVSLAAAPRRDSRIRRRSL